MSNVNEVLDRIAAGRASDPLATVTVIAPSRLASLQLRRRLASRGAFAGVRFETAARLAELVAASKLAREKRVPLARPIADYVATRIARESLAPLRSVSEIPGYARALRQTFRRFRRGGFHNGDEIIQTGVKNSSLVEIARLYTRFREDTARFYDDDDLMETAAEVLRASPGVVLPELGAVYVVPPVRLSAGAAMFLDAIAALAETYEEVDEAPRDRPLERFLLAPDASSEARGVVRSVIADLANGVARDQIAVFTSGDRSYRPLLRQVFEAAGIPDASMPGTPLIEMPAGRGAHALARLALEDYSRVAMFDFLSLAPLRRFVPTPTGDVGLRVSQWLRIAREAGVTHGIARWRASLELYINERRDAMDRGDEISDWRKAALERDIASAEHLRSVVESLFTTLEPLRQRLPASQFVPPFRKLLDTWLERDAAGREQVLNEVDQLGTIDAVQGSFELKSFVEAFEANLSLAAVRHRSLGEGILIADHRQAAGLHFERVYLAGAYEGALPAITTSEPLVQDDDWARLRQTHEFIEDLELRSERSKQAVHRVVAATGSTLMWSAPVAAATAARDYYPSSLMTAAAKVLDPAISSASDLRGAMERSWLTRISSPISALLRGDAVDSWELRLRESIGLKAGNDALFPGHPLRQPVDLVLARRSSRFSEFDGNLAALEGKVWPPSSGRISPSALEAFAACGMRFFLGNVLYLRPVEEPEESQTMGAAERGTLVHHTLQRFFIEEQKRGRPGFGERWQSADEVRLLAIFEEEFEKLRVQGRAGLDIYMDHDRRTIRADLVTFLEKDSDYRIEQGVVPVAFEHRLQPTEVGQVTVSGYIDRIDRSPDGKKAFVIDYKTGSSKRFDMTDEDPFSAGTKLQMPIYSLAAAGAEEIHAAYWFITSAGDFQQLPYVASAENTRRFEDTLDAVVGAMKAGAFPAVPGDEVEFYNSFKNCGYCDFTRICSSRRSYEIQQKSADSDILAWFEVGAVARGERQP